MSTDSVFFTFFDKARRYFSHKKLFPLLDFPPSDLNFDLDIKANKITDEPELFIQVFEETALGDIKKNWKIIKLCKNRLKDLKRIKKRYYPLKSLGKAKRILAHKKDISYIDEVSRELIRDKITDKDIAEEILGKEIPNSKKRKREGKKIKNIRYRYKKRLK